MIYRCHIQGNSLRLSVWTRRRTEQLFLQRLGLILVKGA